MSDKVEATVVSVDKAQKYDDLQGCLIQSFTLDQKIKEIVDAANKQVQALHEKKEALSATVAEILKPFVKVG